MENMTGGEAVVKTLEANGVTVAFGIPGKHNLSLYDALVDHPSIRHILVRNEQAASIMANAVGRVTGKPGICLVSTGPAACNALIGVADAVRESVPVLVVASQVDSSLIDQQKGAFHEMVDQKGMYTSAGAWTARINRVEQIPSAVNAAWAAMTHSRPKPAYLEIPEDVLSAKARVDISPAQKAPDTGTDIPTLTRVSEMLRKAQRPVVYAGGGASKPGVCHELLKFVEKLRIPVVTTINGKGVIPEDHPLSGGTLPLDNPVCREVFSRSDLVFALGAGFGEVSTVHWTVPYSSRLIHVNIDGSLIGKNIPVSVGIAGDVRTVLEQLNAVTAKIHPQQNTDWADEVVGVSGKLAEPVRECPGFELAQKIRRCLPRNAVLVGDAQSWGTWLVYHYPVYGPEQFIWPINFGTLGYSIPAALGVKASMPDRTVIAVCGDGGFTFYSNELATAVQHGLDIIVVLVNNSGFALIRSLQESMFGKDRVFSSDLRNPDFIAYAKSFGCRARSIRTLDELEPALTEAVGARCPALIELPFHIEC